MYEQSVPAHGPHAGKHRGGLMRKNALVLFARHALRSGDRQRVRAFGFYKRDNVERELIELCVHRAVMLKIYHPRAVGYGGDDRARKRLDYRHGIAVLREPFRGILAERAETAVVRPVRQKQRPYLFFKHFLYPPPF